VSLYARSACTKAARKMAAGPRECLICSLRFPADNVLAKHFEACFESHCPAKTTDDEPAAIAPCVHTFNQLRLGSCCIPASGTAYLCRLLPPPARMSIACTSHGAHTVMRDAGLYDANLWQECITFSWAAMWSEAENGYSNLACGCIFQPPGGRTLPALKQNASLVWRALNLGSVDLYIRTMQGSTLCIPILGVYDGSGKRAPVLVHTTVLHLKTLLSRHKAVGGTPVDCMRISNRHSKQLLHDSAPLGAYLWSLSGGRARPAVVLNMLLPMSTARCSVSNHNYRRLRPADFNFMENFRDFESNYAY
jgi:hypothetical protein